MQTSKKALIDNKMKNKNYNINDSFYNCSISSGKSFDSS